LKYTKKSYVKYENKYTHAHFYWASFNLNTQKKLFFFYLSSLMLVVLVDGGHVTAKSSKPRANEYELLLSFKLINLDSRIIFNFDIKVFMVKKNK